MIRSSVVLPEPEGPSSATSSPECTVKLTSRSATKLPNDFVRLRTSIPTVQSPFKNRLDDQRHHRQQRQQRRHGKRRLEHVFVVENLDVQRQRVGFAANL